MTANEVKGLPAANHSGVAGAAADTVHYDFASSVWTANRRRWRELRTSIIIGPDGMIPPLTPEARQRVAESAAKAKGHEMDGPENTPLTSRCIARPNAGPPMIPETYNSNLQIVQITDMWPLKPK